MIEIDKLNDGYYNFPYQSGKGDLSFIQTIDEQFIDYLHTHREQLGSEFGVPPQAFDIAHLAFA